MWFIKIRFVIAPKGQYVEGYYQSVASDPVQAMAEAQAVCAGYSIGTGYKAMIQTAGPIKVDGVTTFGGSWHSFLSFQSSVQRFMDDEYKREQLRNNPPNVEDGK